MAAVASVFRRPRHNKIAQVLGALDEEILEGASAYFGGDTAIALSLDAFRDSIDIDFMCASREGFADLRSRTFGAGLKGLLKSGRFLTETRDLKRDIYGIRSWIDVEGTPVKLEIVSEARIDLDGRMDDRFGVPTLSRSDMYAEKLLANADRGGDLASRHRDVIDLGMMMARWGPIPHEARVKADAAYKGRASEASRRSRGRSGPAIASHGARERWASRRRRPPRFSPPSAALSSGTGAGDAARVSTTEGAVSTCRGWTNTVC